MFDIVIPFHKKDSAVINYCLEGCFKNLNFRKVYILTSLKNKPLFKKYKQVEVIDENSFFKDLSLLKIIFFWLIKNIRYVHKTPCWLYQQLLKMACSYKLEGLSKNYLVLDADIVFLRPIKMEKENKALMCSGTEYHQPYFEMIKRLLGFKPKREYSFISHHQMINKKLMREMLKRICNKDQKNWQDKWYKILLKKYDYSQKNGFSEYETYGHFLKHFYPKAFKIRKLKWKNLRKKPNQSMINELAEKYDFVCFHTSWRRKKWF